MIDFSFVELISESTTCFVVAYYGTRIFRVTYKNLIKKRNAVVEPLNIKFKGINLKKAKLNIDFFNKYLGGNIIEFKKLNKKSIYLFAEIEKIKKSISDEEFKIFELDIKQKCFNLFKRRETLNEISFKMNPEQLKEAKEALVSTISGICYDILNYSENCVKVNDAEMNYILGKKPNDIGWFSEENKNDYLTCVNQIPSNFYLLENK